MLAVSCLSAMALSGDGGGSGRGLEGKGEVIGVFCYLPSFLSYCYTFLWLVT